MSSEIQPQISLIRHGLTQINTDELGGLCVEMRTTEFDRGLAQINTDYWISHKDRKV